MCKKKTHQSGFTLVEILASVVLLTVVISLFLTLVPQMFAMNDRTEDNLKATLVAKEVIAAIKQRDYDSQLNALLVSSPPKYDFTIDNDIKYKPYNIKVTINPTPDVSGTIQKLYRLTVDVKDKNGKILTTTYGYFDK